MITAPRTVTVISPVSSVPFSAPLPTRDSGDSSNDYSLYFPILT